MKSGGQVKVVCIVDELRRCLDEQVLAVILHFEAALRKPTHENWLRVLGKTWRG